MKKISTQPRISVSPFDSLPARTVLGGDVSKRSIDFCLLHMPPGASTFHREHCKLPNTVAGCQALQAWLTQRQVGSLHACFEATGTYALLSATHLYQLGHQVSIVNPSRIHHYAKSRLSRAKTDRADAALIAEFCLKEQPVLWKPMASEEQMLRDLARQLTTLKDTKTEYELRLQEQGRRAPTVQQTTRAMIQTIERQIEKLWKAILRHLQKHPKLQERYEHYMSVKGVGPMTALIILAEMPALESFQSARKAAAFAGVAPGIKESGSSVRGASGMCKIGNPSIRAVLYMAALTAKRFDPGLRAFAQRLHEAGKPPKVVTGAIMRKLIHILYGIAKTGQPAYAHNV